MIHNLNGSGRRVLTFPATDTLSASTLVQSLLYLSHEIRSLKSKIPSTNKRNASEMFRLIENVSIFLEEIQLVSSADLPDSGILSLTDLKLSFQKVLYLLEDCTRDSARLWMAMSSSQVVDRFRVLTRAIGTDLEVFPLESGQLSDEVEELVEFVKIQARKARFEIEQDDQRAMDIVNRIFGQFRDGSDLDFTQVKFVLDHIRVRTWFECNEEIKFLEGEIELKLLNREKNANEISFLTSLIGFMIYCQCVMFDYQTQSQQKVKACEVEVFNGLDLDDFRCPISFEVMKDPVTLCTGHTYDRSSILKWFRSGNYTCPITGNKLTSIELVPNLALKHIIQQCCANVPKSKKEAIPWSLEAKGALKMVSLFLVSKLDCGTRLERNKAASEIRILTKTSDFSRSCLVESGVVPHLLDLMLSSLDSCAQENAVAGLLNLSKDSRNRFLIAEHGGLEVIVYVLKKGLKVESRHHAAATIFYMSSVEDYRRHIGENHNSIQGLLKLLREGNTRGKRNALVAILGLLMYCGNHSRVLRAGIVPLLVDLMKPSDGEELATDSLAVLAKLSENPDGASTILRHGELDIILQILESSSMAGKEYCVSLLLALCINGGAHIVSLLVKSPSLMGSLYSLISEGTPRGSKKASALISILHEFNERRSSGIMDPVPRDHSIHVCQPRLGRMVKASASLEALKMLARFLKELISKSASAVFTY
ncbi:U-box domain-containing protein 18-like [Rutidosis leptorrhynchoides]|uniref:U-box domain-containing protein 18-like n=1 Tax=Rutidosis leptorrhynchoides TaxID=125765 RepID=UPI003A99DF92